MSSACDRAFEMLRHGRERDAYAMFREIVRGDRSAGMAWAAMGEALAASKKWELAAACFRAALPNHEAALRLAQMLVKLGRPGCAMEYARRAAQRLDTSMAWYTVAFCGAMLGNVDKALEAATRSRELAPDQADIRYLIGCILLSRGDWGGFVEYDARFGISPPRGPKPNEPPWQGEPLKGKMIHVLSEQGFGDVLMFARFVPALREDGAQVIWMVPPEMLALLRRSFPKIEMYPYGSAPPQSCDYHVYLGSIPRWRGGNYRAAPYIKGRIAKKKRSQGAKKAIGIAWQGDPRHECDHLRSAPVHSFVPLVSRRRAVYSLQIGGPPPDEAVVGPIGIIEDLATQIANFDDTASIIAGLDCIVSVDSAVAHLAGAMGKECHLLVPCGAVDWRWHHGVDSSPWYPSIRLWRQREGQPWRDVVGEVARFLEDTPWHNRRADTR